MKHEILFRGRRLDNGEWVEGHFFRSSTRAYIITMVDDTGTWAKSPRLLFAEVDPDTVGQFAGLLDKHGKKIFEDDRCNAGLGGIGTIEYEDGAFIIYYDEPIDGDWTSSLLCVIDGDVEVIGTHDNPELMQGGVIDHTTQK